MVKYFRADSVNKYTLADTFTTTNYDIVIVGQTVGDIEYSSKVDTLDAKPIPILTFSGYNYDEFHLGVGEVKPFGTGRKLIFGTHETKNHWINKLENDTTIAYRYDNKYLYAYTGADSTGRNLVSIITDDAFATKESSLAVICEKGGKLIDNSTAAERRAFCGFAESGTFNPETLEDPINICSGYRLLARMLCWTAYDTLNNYVDKYACFSDYFDIVDNWFEFGTEDSAFNMGQCPDIRWGYDYSKTGATIRIDSLNKRIPTGKTIDSVIYSAHRGSNAFGVDGTPCWACSLGVYILWADTHWIAGDTCGLRPNTTNKWSNRYYNKFNTIAWAKQCADSSGVDRDSLAMDTLYLDSASTVVGWEHWYLTPSKVQAWRSGTRANNGFVIVPFWTWRIPQGCNVEIAHASSNTNRDIGLNNAARFEVWFHTASASGKKKGSIIQENNKGIAK